MAKKRQQKTPNTSSNETNTFVKGMIKDFNPSFQPKANWTHARNAVNNSVDGDVGMLGNEPANILCANIPYTVIGAIHLYGDEWVIYSTDNTSSEIGLFDDSECKYETLVNDACLSFNKKHLITGAAKENFDCSWQVYWDDGLNPSRTLNIDDIPYKQIQTTGPDINGDPCIIYQDTDELDCERIRLAPLLDTPVIKLSKATDGGQLRNGAYQAYIAYTVNEQRVTDYIGMSNIQTLFDHEGTAGALDIKVSNLDKEFEFFELVILSNNQNNYAAKRIGLYSTEASSIGIDFIDPALPSIPLELIPLMGPAYEKSDAMFVVNDYLIRKGPTEQFDFNYQPIANQIKAEWVVAEYPSSYYYKGGNKTGFMRDEQYAFFIRWIYNTGEKSKSYHIPGRAPRVNGKTQWGQTIDETQISSSINSLDSSEMNYQVYNTATVTGSNIGQQLPDGGILQAKGDMGYWQSTEIYPPTQPEIWNATYVDPETNINIGSTTETQYDLCGRFIRHHKFPTEETGSGNEWLNLTGPNEDTIRILGVQFSNIKRPKYNDGTYIENLVGYEILRGSREGAKSILAKGLFKNMRKYEVPDTSTSGVQGLYPNYPYNDLNPDFFFHTGQNGRRTDGSDRFDNSLQRYPALDGYTKDVFTFHSPELMFKRPFLNAYETRIYGTKSGLTTGKFLNSEKHPQNKLLRNGAAIVASIFGVGYGLEKIRGRKKKVYTPRKPLSIDQFGGLALGTGAWAAPTFGASTPQSGVTAVGAAAGQAIIDTIINEILLDSAYAIGDMATGGVASMLGYDVAALVNDGVQSLLPGGIGGGWKYEIDGSELKETPTVALALTGFMNFAQQFSVGTNEMIEMMYNLVSFEDFAMKYNSHGFYGDFEIGDASSRWRMKNKDSNYVGSVFQTFGEQGEFKINNLFRPKTIAVQTEDELDIPTQLDNSRVCFGSLVDDGVFGNGFYKKYGSRSVERKCSALYGALKFAFENQYGQLDQIKQVPMRPSVEMLDLDASPQTLYSTQPIFSGDIYIGRFTEKCIMPIFTDFLYGQPDQYPFDYLMRVNIPYPRYHMDTRRYDITKVVEEITSFNWNASNWNNALPNDLFYLDRRPDSANLTWNDINANSMPVFHMRHAYMYTHINGINDFFVESEVNLAQRDWEDQRKKRFYDTYEYNNLNDLFDAEHIKEDNFYKYDYSLSASRFITNLSTYGFIQPRDYDPKVAEKCFIHYPKRLIYSLRAQQESKKDFWRVFLPNNYKDFKNPVNVIKPVNKTGALIFFPYQSPQMFQGVDQLKGDGTKFTIGDGGLFQQPLQNVVNSDLSNEYASCESMRTALNTPMGMFFISQAQGKVFHYTGKLENIANQGMKWWFNKYLPSQLIRQFPLLEESLLADNPVVGVGCQTIYDINNDIVYFTKRDFKVKDQYVDNFYYTEETGFISDPLGILASDPTLEPSQVGFPVELGDPQYFDDCSWTVSYDPKAKAWISFHDWHPELCLSSINHFLTTKSQSSGEPYCPPGYVFNPDTNMCEITLTETAPAPVVIDEVGANVTGGQNVNCNIDIVVAMDVSNSTLSQNRREAQQLFLTKFLESDPISNGLDNGTIQIGFTKWSGCAASPPTIPECPQTDPANGIAASMNPNGFSLANNITETEVTNWYNFLPDGGWVLTNGNSTNIYHGLAHAAQIRNQRALSELGDRSNTPGYRSIIIFITDAQNSVAQSPNPNHPDGGWSVQYQSSNIGGGTALPYEEVVAVFCGADSDVPTYAPAANLLNYITAVPVADGGISVAPNFDNHPNMYGINADNPDTINAAAIAMVDQVCSTQGVCSCPEGYTLVYPTGNTYTGTTGPCPSPVNPICRRVTCECPPPPFEGAVTSETGQCDNVYQAGPNGNPEYVNTDPKTCTFFFQQSVPPSYDGGSIWRHNARCDLFVNYYNQDYPWEVEFVENTGQIVNTVRSLEYQLESYVYKGDNLINACADDRWHDLDFNFDELIIHNSEQVSGLLNIIEQQKNDPIVRLDFPQVNFDSIDILAAKVEQKYRINQFWDSTNDRGEFSNAEQRIFETGCNGYIRDLNLINIDYNKSALQRKKFRHYFNKFLLRRRISGDRKMLLKLNNTKLNLSFR